MWSKICFNFDKISGSPNNVPVENNIISGQIQQSSSSNNLPSNFDLTVFETNLNYKQLYVNETGNIILFLILYV